MKASGWTLERRANQAAAIRRWRPWEQSTGPRTESGKVVASRNADKGGRRERLRAEVRELRAMLTEHNEVLEAARMAQVHATSNGHL